MRIESIEVKNYRVFRDAKFENLSPLSIIIGANGSGKSTLIDVFSFLKEAVQQNVAHAVARRGGYKELVSRSADGRISFTIKFRERAGRLATYRLEITGNGGQAEVAHERLGFDADDVGDAWEAFNLSAGTGLASKHDSSQTPMKDNETLFMLDNPSVLALNIAGQLKEFPVVSELRSHIENWHVSDFHVDDARPSSGAEYSEHLSTRGDNVAQVARYLYEHHPEQFHKILEKMSERVPGVTKVEVKPTEDERLVLRFKDGSFRDPFSSRYVSDGTLKLFAYLVLLHDPKPHPLLAVEEPENQLYPELLYELLEEFRDYARRGGQVFVSTHSPDFLNGAKLDEIYWLVKENGFTTVRRASDSELLRKLIQEGDIPGALWKQGLFEGAGLR